MNAPPDSGNGDQPIGLLALQEQETSTDFVGRVRRSIQRRASGGQIVSFAWDIPKLIFLELAMLIAHLLHTSSDRKEP